MDTDTRTILDKGNVPNEDILERIYANDFNLFLYERYVTHTAGVFGDQTLVWIGRFIEAAAQRQARVGNLTRQEVKSQLLKPFSKKKGSADSQIRNKMIVIWGPVKTKTKGVTDHAWQALGLAEAWLQKNE